MTRGVGGVAAFPDMRVDPGAAFTMAASGVGRN